jgi:NAD+ diphosphatase
VVVLNPTPVIAGFSYAAVQVDRADALRDDTDALADLWQTGQLLILNEKGEALSDAGGMRLPVTGSDLGGGPGAAVFLGLLEGRAWFAIDAASVSVTSPQQVGLRFAAAHWPEAEAGLYAYARSMLHWHARARHCGICGNSISFQRAGFIGYCTQCGGQHYPRVDPAVIAAISDGERLLLGRPPSWSKRRYSLIAGFMEPGETPEQAVSREAYEETRIRVHRCQYLAAQPWPFPGALMLGFLAEAEPGIPHVNGELADARWFDRDMVGRALTHDSTDDDAALLLAPQISIARALIEYWYRQM